MIKGLNKSASLMVTIPLSVFFFLTSFYCSRPDSDTHSDDNNKEVSRPRINNLIIQQPDADESFALGDPVEVQVEFEDPSLMPDSVRFFAGNKVLFTLSGEQKTATWLANLDKVGRSTLRAIAHYDSITESKSVTITLLSDVVPQTVNYTIVNEYPHDPEAFTQGLVYDNGYFFESTGHYGKSTVRKVEKETGKILQVNQLGQEFFGEGLAIYGSRLFQLTWREQVGFIYDKESFQMMQKVYYDIKEGWGLTYDGNQFIISDGTSKLYFVEPEYFTETGRLQVYDNKGMVPYLNELEFINGKIFANIWGKETIAIIEPSSGKVTHYLDFTKSVPANLKGESDKVLNGIAFDPQSGNLFITGKNWPVLYELRYSLP